MRTIVKIAEPASLVEYRANPRANYDDYREKDDLRICLVSEQRGLCCYCLSRIRAEQNAMKIEHWHSQNRYNDEQLAYANLLGACKGNENESHRNQHCDTFKGNRDLSRNPANQLHRVGELMKFGGDGRASSSDPGFAVELDEVLNLNLPFLVNNRKAVLDAFKEAMPKRGPLLRATLEKWLLDWNGESTDGELRPFCQIIVYWIRKRLARP
jgi:uncharacterized protein (TIGR02646 family)